MVDARRGLSEELLEIYRGSYGVGAAEVGVEISDRFVVFYFDGLELLPNEQILIEAAVLDGATGLDPPHLLAVLRLAPA